MPGRARRFQAAAIQMTSTADVERNLARARALVREAARAGARLVGLPENFAYLKKEGSPPALRETLDGELVRTMQREARELRVHLLLGSIPERLRGSRRIHNTSVLIGPSGRVLAAYRKLHLFDVSFAGAAELRESSTVAPGSEVVVADASLGKLGLSICYDLRFPELYRQLVLRGATVLCVPAAFTAYTGPHHWLPLLRARAIENQCWVFAPAQVGRHHADRRSHGETAIVDPWGRVAARLPAGEGFVTAEIDLGEVQRIRRGLPCLRHLRRELLGRSAGSAARGRAASRAARSR